MAHYAYDDLSRRTTVTYANDATTEYSYDSGSRIADVNHVTNDDQHQFLYTYDDVGNRLSMTAFGSDLYTYTYDNTYQLTDVNYPSAHFMPDTTFEYDEAGNRDAVIDTSTDDYVANALNQYNQAGSDYLDYDQTGNLTYDGVSHYLYDAENRLIQITESLGGGNSEINAGTDSDLSFTLSGDANWYFTDQEYYHDGNDTGVFAENRDSVRSGAIAANQTSIMKATVLGEGTITYWSKVSSKDTPNPDSFVFAVDGSVKETRRGEDPWAEKSVVITGIGYHTLEWRYNKGSSGPAGSDCVWIDHIQWAPSTPTVVTALQEAVDAGWPVITGGDANWSKRTSGAFNDGDCAKSGTTTASQTSQMLATVEGSGTVSFYWKVSSEQNSDELTFYLDGVEKVSISGEVAWQQKSYTLSGSGSHTLLWEYKKDGSVNEGSDAGWVDYVQGPGTTPPQPDPYAEALDSDLSYTAGGDNEWYALFFGYNDGDSCESGGITDDEESWLQTTVEGEETVSFWWKVSSESGYDYLKFYIDNVFKDKISGDVDWAQKTYNLSGSGTHTLKWRYIKDGSESSGDDSGSVDYVQWSGAPVATLDPANWSTANYTYDPRGRRIEKNIDGFITRYVYDNADNVLAEYNDNGDLLRKYVYGPRVDEPICMIEVADNNAVYYYHTDALGTVVALTDVDGNSVQTYTYSVYGQVAASDPNHTNPYLFTGRRYDTKSGLYYYRARMYSTFLGRFMQADPIGYGDGLNWYRYARNNPTRYRDPMGTDPSDPCDPCDPNIDPPSPAPPAPPVVDPTPDPDTGPPSFDDTDCANAKPSSDINDCNVHGNDSRWEGGSLWRAKCVCECAGNSKWDQKARGCLACAQKAGIPTEISHKHCYALADAMYPVRAVTGRIDIGLRCGGCIIWFMDPISGIPGDFPIAP